MPKFLEEKLKKEAAKKGFSGRRADRYVYGAMNNEGLMHGNKETAKGAAAERKHIDNGHRQVRNRASHAGKLKHG